MITFRKKSLTENLVPEAIEHLDKEGVNYSLISPSQADSTSKVNSKAMVLMSFEKTERGTYQIVVKDKEFYPYTRKFIGDPSYCRMRITDTNQNERTVTAEVDHLGIALDVIEILGIKYNLSIVNE